MVTKRLMIKLIISYCSVLAKIHMVTKRSQLLLSLSGCSVLAKIHMVTKPQIHDITNHDLNYMN